jgi:Mrp family chromosome partitioning ATPase
VQHTFGNKPSVRNFGDTSLFEDDAKANDEDQNASNYGFYPLLGTQATAMAADNPLLSSTWSLLNSDQMNRLIDEVRRRFDVVLFDCPPILGVSDSSIMTNLADATIIVTQHRRFPRSMLARVKKTVLNAGGNLLGVVLNNVDVRHDHQYQYYTSYYHYYPGPKSNGERATEKPAPARPVARAKSAVTEDEY